MYTNFFYNYLYTIAVFVNILNEDFVIFSVLVIFIGFVCLWK